MFERLGWAVNRHRRVVLIVMVLATFAAGAVGVGVIPRLQSGGFNDPGSDSAEAGRVLDEEFGSPQADVILAVVSAPGTAGGVDAPSTAALGKSLASSIAHVPGVMRVSSYWQTPAPALRSADGSGGLILVTYDSKSEVPVKTITNDIGGVVAGVDPGSATVYLGGGENIAKAINSQISSDLARAESIALPVTFLLLLIVFGSLVAAGMPLLVGIGAIFGSFLVLFLATFMADVSVFALNLVTGLGLGLGIDYSLLIVSRFREELNQGHDVGKAVARTVATAGRTVVFSGLTVGVTVAAMVFFPQFFLRSFAYAGISVVIFAVLGALIALPAALGILGPRINRLRIRKGIGRTNQGRRWATLATWIMHRPWPVLILSIAVLVILALPLTGVKFSQIDERALPASNQTVVATAEINDGFPALGGVPIEVLVPGADTDIAGYTGALSEVKSIERAVSSAGVFVGGARVAAADPTLLTVSGDYQRIVVSSTERPRSPEGEIVIASVRAVPTPIAGVMVGGFGAEYADSQQGLARNLPLAFGWVLISVLILLFLFTGSVLLPIKAVILNVLSLGAAMGAVVWVFQDGHLKWLVGDFTVTGSIDTSSLVLTIVVAFGLSMDYEVFLLSRIKEEFLLTGDNTLSVARGLQRSAGIITAAALLLAIVFAAFISSSVTNIKILGFGVAVAILLDATIVRVLLVPAFMRIAGRANWWAPKPLRLIYMRLGIKES